MSNFPFRKVFFSQSLEYLPLHSGIKPRREKQNDRIYDKGNGREKAEFFLVSFE